MFKISEEKNADYDSDNEIIKWENNPPLQFKVKQIIEDSNGGPEI